MASRVYAALAADSGKLSAAGLAERLGASAGVLAANPPHPRLKISPQIHSRAGAEPATQ
jgi:hypothetical protein